MPDDERIAKIMAHRGMCSRREAERLIGAGQVIVDGVVVDQQGSRAGLDADIQIKGKGQTWLDDRITVLLNKPVGVVSTQPEGDQQPAWQLLTLDNHHGKANTAIVKRVCAHPYYLNVAGRLDRASRGLLLLTQDGVLARRITCSHEFEKRYLVTVEETIHDDVLNRLRGRFELDGKRLRPMQVKPAGRNVLRFSLVEGRKHQLRRICERVGLTVTDLLREAVGPWTLGDLPEGKWRIPDTSRIAER